MQESPSETPSFFPLCKFDDSDLERQPVAELISGSKEVLEEGETLASVLAAEGPSTTRVIRVKSRWFLSDGEYSSHGRGVCRSALRFAYLPCARGMVYAWQGAGRGSRASSWTTSKTRTSSLWSGLSTGCQRVVEL